MKLFQQLLVAPAALGLLAPMAVNAAEININDVASYSDTQEINTSAQFSDVIPGDWAYKALQNLSESYGCVDNSYTQNLKSGQALTRYEAAALVNACLDGGLLAGGEGLTSDAVRLADEFGSEMAILKGRVDGLEYKLREVSAGQFSSTTKMSGSVNMTTGAVDNGTLGDALHSVYEIKYGLKTSFTGQDALVTKFELGNATNDSLAVDVTSANGANIAITDLYYSFPVGDNWKITTGPLMDGDAGLPGTDTAYSEKVHVEATTSNYSGANGPAVAVAWTGDNGWNAGVNFVSDDGQNAGGTGAANPGGIFTEEGNDDITLQVGYDADSWGLAASYLDGGSEGAIGAGVYFTPGGDFPFTFSASFEQSNPVAAGDTTEKLTLTALGDLGPGKLGVGYEAAHDDDGIYEAYYDYQVADGFTITPMIWVRENTGAVATDDETGVAFNANFKF